MLDGFLDDYFTSRVTIDQFRSIPQYTERMRSILADETFQLALLTIKDSKIALEVHADEADAIVSVRAHSRTVGFFDGLAKLLRMGDTLVLPEQHEESTYEPEAP